MSTCCGFGRRKKGDDVEALLPEYQDDTTLQRRLHQKMHTYQMLRALSSGCMPSTEQLVINLRTLMASDTLNPDEADLSDSGRRLIRYCKQWLNEFIQLLQDKNSKDQFQDFVWFLSKAQLSLDTQDMANQASNIKAKADSKAGQCHDHSTGNFLTYLQPTRACVLLVVYSLPIPISAFSWEI